MNTTSAIGLQIESLVSQYNIPPQAADWLRTIGADADKARANSPGTIERLRKALDGLYQHVERNTRPHESTHRGGIAWTICDDCGARWADDDPVKGPGPHSSLPDAMVEAGRVLRGFVGDQPGWFGWDTVAEQDGKTVLVRFRHERSRINGNDRPLFHVESALIEVNDDGAVQYVLFDGQSFNTRVQPVGWHPMIGGDDVSGE